MLHLLLKYADDHGLEVEPGFEGLLIEARGLYVRSFHLRH